MMESMSLNGWNDLFKYLLSLADSFHVLPLQENAAYMVVFSCISESHDLNERAELYTLKEWKNFQYET
jgi:hypothetical protein